MKMMMNLFSTFDPSTGMMSMNWVSIMTFILLPSKFWSSSNNILILIKILTIKMSKESESMTKIKGMSMITNSMFLMIMLINLMGLLPYVFTSSSHLTFSLSMSMPIWMSLMIYGWMFKTKSMLKHLVPMSTPSMLMPFMVMIETISNMIRPSSLAIRLTANMIAGHVLMSLLGDSTKSMLKMSMMMIMYMSLMMFESAVAIIQSYVFMTLSNLYSSEI
uniref:ATP synthase subunit a n=1 Tax=Balala fujiana TaxID=2800226 RepID=A0A7T6YCN3_9HEMI|nr:ATP synthase F0 subunit 6 [Balala fujiana]QQK57698.1 ATP synthase F0 subunit 6 [Balala fujiana]